MECTSHPQTHVPWNKGEVVGQKAPFKPKEVWAIRVRRQVKNRARERALFDLGIDSKLRACDLVKLRVLDVCHGDQIASRITVLQRKTHRSVQFEISPATREAVEAWIRKVGLKTDDYLFASLVHRSPHLDTRQYTRILDGWVLSVGLEPAGYGTDSMRRTKASLTYRRTMKLRAVQFMLGHSKLASTVRYLDIKVDDALELAEQTDV